MPDIGILAPGVCLQKVASDNDSLDVRSAEGSNVEFSKKKDILIQFPQYEVDDEDLDKLGEDEDDFLPVSTQFDQLQSRLLGCLNKESADQIAVDFAWINSKVARKRLIRFLLLHSKSRADLLPFFGRLIACLNSYIPEIGEIIIKTVSFFSEL